MESSRKKVIRLVSEGNTIGNKRIIMIGTAGECKHCHNSFIRKNGDSRKAYCSTKCVHLAQIRVQWPSNQELLAMVKDMSMLSIGRILKCSARAVAKRRDRILAM